MRTLRFVAVMGIFLSVAGVRQAQAQVNWLTDWRQARDVAKSQQRLILLHFWSDSCAPCKMLDRKVFNRQDVARAVQSGYIPVKVNVDSDRQLAQHYRVEKVPTDIIVDASGRVLHQTISPQDPLHYVALLDQVKSHHSVAMLSSGSRTTPTQTPANETSAAKPASGLATAPNDDSATATRGSAYVSPQQVASTTPVANNLAANNPLSTATQPQQAKTSGPYANPFANKPAAQTPAAKPQPQIAAGIAPANTTAANTAPANAANATSAYQPLTNSPPAVANRGTNWTPPASPGRTSAGAAGITNQFANRQPAGRTSTGIAAQGPAARQAMTNPPHRPPLPTQGGGVGLEGYCPVTLVERNTWTRGDARWGANHQGRVYLFANAENQRRFLAAPNKYAPILSGYDPVRYVDAGMVVDGKRRHGLYYGDMYFLFADEGTLQQFQVNPMKYVPPEMLR